MVAMLMDNNSKIYVSLIKVNLTLEIKILQLKARKQLLLFRNALTHYCLTGTFCSGIAKIFDL